MVGERVIACKVQRAATSNMLATSKARHVSDCMDEYGRKYVCTVARRPAVGLYDPIGEVMLSELDLSRNYTEWCKYPTNQQSYISPRFILQQVFCFPCRCGRSSLKATRLSNVKDSPRDSLQKVNNGGSLSAHSEAQNDFE